MAFRVVNASRRIFEWPAAGDVSEKIERIRYFLQNFLAGMQFNSDYIARIAITDRPANNFHTQGLPFVEMQPFAARLHRLSAEQSVHPVCQGVLGLLNFFDGQQDRRNMLAMSRYKAD